MYKSSKSRKSVLAVAIIVAIFCNGFIFSVRFQAKMYKVKIIPAKHQHVMIILIDFIKYCQLG